jgi:hypothetical protein
MDNSGMSQPSDTSPEAERVLAEVYRLMPVDQKWAQLGEMYTDARALHAAGMRLRQPGATSEHIHRAWLRAHCDPLPSDLLQGPIMDLEAANLRGVREVTDVLDRLGIRYALGGSLASSLHGIDRYTRDADLTAEPFPGKETELVASFGPNIYISLGAVQDALRRRSAFNIINTRTGFKVDIFIRKDDPFEQAALERRIGLSLPDAPGRPLFVLSAEDVILFKLRWFRLGGESSQQQWTDIQGILRVQTGKLDSTYLDRWAADLNVADLLARAGREGAPESPG